VLCVHKVKKNATKSSQPNSHIRWLYGVVSKPVFQGPSVSVSSVLTTWAAAAAARPRI